MIRIWSKGKVVLSGLRKAARFNYKNRQFIRHEWLHKLSSTQLVIELNHILRKITYIFYSVNLFLCIPLAKKGETNLTILKGPYFPESTWGRSYKSVFPKLASVSRCLSQHESYNSRVKNLCIFHKGQLLHVSKSLYPVLKERKLLGSSTGG